MRRCCVSLAAAMAVAALTDRPGAAQQTLDLESAWGPADSPPALGLDTHAGRCMAVVRDEMVVLAEEAATADPQLQEALRASINLRGVAGKLLEQGDRAEDRGSLLVLAGYRLFRGRAELDQVLRDSAGSAAGIETIRQFNRLAPGLPMDLPPEDAASLDAQCAAVIGPLAELAGALAGEEATDHWIPRTAVSSAAAEPAGLDPALARLDQGAVAAALAPETVQLLAAISEYLNRGASFQEFRPQIDRYARLLTDVIDLAVVIADAGWMDEDSKAASRDRIHQALISFADPQTRGEGSARLAQLAALARPIAALSALSEPAPAGSRGAVPGKLPRIDLEPARAAVLAALAADPDPTGDPQWRLEALEGTLERMIAYRAADEPRISRDLLRVWRALDDSYQRTERDLAKRAPELLAAGGGRSDPELASLIASHRQYFDDLNRVAQMPAWVESVRLIDPRAAGPFAARMRKAATWLTDPIRRPEAVAALDHLEAQLQLLASMPHEQEIRLGGRAVIIATGALQAELAAAIERERGSWVQRWGSSADQGDGRLEQLSRLTAAIGDASALLEPADGVESLNRWAAWELDPEMPTLLASSLAGRLKLATTAAIEGDDAGLAMQLDHIDTSPARLIGALADRLAEPLENLPGGALSIAGQSIHGPSPDSWMLRSRRDLADLCRYTMELEQARATGRQELAERLTTYVDGLAQKLWMETNRR